MQDLTQQLDAQRVLLAQALTIRSRFTHYSLSIGQVTARHSDTDSTVQELRKENAELQEQLAQLSTTGRIEAMNDEVEQIGYMVEELNSKWLVTMEESSRLGDNGLKLGRQNTLLQEQLSMMRN